MSHRSISRRGWCAAAAATALAASTIVAASAPAGAAPGENQGNIVFRDHFTFKDSHIEQEEHGDEFCADVPFLVLWEGQGVITDMTMVRRGDRYFGSFKATSCSTRTASSSASTPAWCATPPPSTCTTSRILTTTRS